MALPTTIKGGQLTLEGDLSGITDWESCDINFKTKREERTPAKLNYPRRLIDMFDVTIEPKGMMGLGGVPPNEGELIEVVEVTIDDVDAADLLASYPDIANLGDVKWGKWRAFDTKFSFDRTKADWSFVLEPGYSGDTTMT